MVAVSAQDPKSLEKRDQKPLMETCTSNKSLFCLSSAKYEQRQVAAIAQKGVLLDHNSSDCDLIEQSGLPFTKVLFNVHRE
jgi:hypothetical protein